MGTFYLRPDADDTDGNWTNESGNNTNLYASIDETSPSDADYIRSSSSPAEEVTKIRISDPSVAVDRGLPIRIRYRYWKDVDRGTFDLRTRLLQGTTEIAAWTEAGITTTPTTTERTLTAPEVATITDFTNLFLEMTATYTSPPDVEQDTGNQSSTNTISDTSTFTGATVSGRGVIVTFALKGGRRVATLTDNMGNVYTRVGFVVDVSDAVAEMWYTHNITGGANHTLTVTYDAAAYCVWGALEVSRVKGGGGFLDARTIATFARDGVGSSGSISVTSGVPRGSNELFVAMLALAGGGANAGINTPATWTPITLFNDFDSVMAGQGVYKLISGSAAQTVTWTNGTTTAPAAAIIAAFRATNAISAGIAAPVNTVLPVISGTPIVDETLSTTTGTWDNQPDSYTYQWRDDGVAIPGATASTYALTTSDIDANITVIVTATNEGGSTGATSAAVGPVEGDPYFNNIVLLTDLEGANNSTTTITDDSWYSRPVLFTGSAIISTSNFKFGTSSLAPSPTGGVSGYGYAYCSDSDDWRFPGEFTIECWIYPGGGGITWFTVLDHGASTTTSWAFEYLLNLTTCGLRFRGSLNGSTHTSVEPAGFAATNTTWQHIAVTRDVNNVIRLFRNGVLLDTTGTISGTLFNSTAVMRIGYSALANIPAACRIDEVRITNGVCRYTASFTPRTTRFVRMPLVAPVNLTAPAITGAAYVGESLSASTGTWTTLPTYAYQWKRDGSNISGATNSTYWTVAADAGATLTVQVTATNTAGSTAHTSAGLGAISANDQHFSNVILLTAFDGTNGATTTTDDSPTTPHTITFNGGSSISTAQSKFGASSLLLNGSTGYLTIPTNTDFDLSNTVAQSFTIEGWIRRSSAGTAQAIIGNYTSQLGGLWYLHIQSTNELLLTYWDGSAFRSSITTGAAAAATNTWMHIAASGSLSGGTMTTRLYIDGVYKATVSYTLAGTNNSTLNIGRLPLGTPERYFNGYIDELRFTKGVARYTTETSFAVPTEGYPRS